MSLHERLRALLLPPELEAQLATNPKKIGSLGYDQWGLNTEATQLAAGLMKPIYEHYFRTEAYGLENIPANGRVLIIANHSGFLPVDGTLIGYAMTTNPHAPRVPRAMIERFFPTIPWLGNLLNGLGAVVGDVQNCVDMLENDEAVIVFPEGVRGTGKGYTKRYNLQRFGNGFMHLAIETGTPIIPVGVVGCEEALPMFGNVESLARLLQLPYIPVGLPLPLPTKVILHFGEPLHFIGPVDDEAGVAGKVEQVKTRIRELIDLGLATRKGVYA